MTDLQIVFCAVCNKIPMQNKCGEVLPLGDECGEAICTNVMVWRRESWGQPAPQKGIDAEAVSWLTLRLAT